MFGTTPLIMIEDDAALIAAAERLSAAPVIGVDTEADSFHSYREKVCLVQLSDLENDYIVDPLKDEEETLRVTRISYRPEASNNPTPENCIESFLNLRAVARRREECCDEQDDLS